MECGAPIKANPDLIYYPDTAPGIRRRRHGRGFSYIAPDDTRIDQRQERARINALAVPHAYEDVWICPLPNGHLQATGRDARARKQYRYHADWTALRAARKFDHLADFGAALPRIRRHIRESLRADAGTRDFAVAAVLALLDRASMRVGHPEYTESNQSFGASTLRLRHVTLGKGEITLQYVAKGGRPVRKRLRDATLNRVFGRLHDLPGKTLITWIDNQGQGHEVRSETVNGQVQEITGDDRMTAKSFRTWNGSAAALEVVLAEPSPTIKALSEAAAHRLHNSPAMARNSYIHPSVIDLVERDAEARAEIAQGAEDVRGLRRAEAQLLYLLRND